MSFIGWVVYGIVISILGSFVGYHFYKGGSSNARGPEI